MISDFIRLNSFMFLSSCVLAFVDYMTSISH
nr:MAG TPA: hypothetical protein [Caudoviricetes sp.]